jgi:hypothetical protein
MTTSAVIVLSISLVTSAVLIYLAAKAISVAINALKEAVNLFTEALKPVAKAVACLAGAVAFLAAYFVVQIRTIQGVLLAGAFLAASAAINYAAGRITAAFLGFLKTELGKLDKKFWEHEKFLITAKWWQLGFIAVRNFAITVGALDIAFQLIVVGHHHPSRVVQLSLILLTIPAIAGMEAFGWMCQHLCWDIQYWWKERRAARSHS